MKSHIDNLDLEGLASIRLHSSRDFVSDKCNRFIRWSEVFLLRSSPEQLSNIDFDPPDPMSTSSLLAKAVCSALVGHLKRLVTADITTLAVRFTLDPENVMLIELNNMSIFEDQILLEPIAKYLILQSNFRTRRFWKYYILCQISHISN